MSFMGDVSNNPHDVFQRKKVKWAATDPYVLYFIKSLVTLGEEYNRTYSSSLSRNVRPILDTACDVLKKQLNQEISGHAYALETIRSYHLSFETALRKTMQHPVDKKILRSFFFSLKRAEVYQWVRVYQVGDTAEMLKMQYTLFLEKSDLELRQLRLALKPLRKQYKLVFSSLNFNELQSNIQQYQYVRDQWETRYKPHVQGLQIGGDEALSLIDYTDLNQIILPADEIISNVSQQLAQDLEAFPTRKYGSLQFLHSGMTWSHINTIIDSIKL